MKILFVNTTLFGANGISRVLSSIASALTERHDVTVMTFENEANVDRNRYNLSPKVHVVFKKAIYNKCYIRRAVHKLNQKTGILPFLNIPALFQWTYLPKHLTDAWVEFINEHKFDVVVGVQAKGAYILGSCVGRIKCKTIGWQHNSYEAYLENKGLYYWNQDYLFETYIPKLTNYVVLNEHDKNRYLEMKGIKATSIYNPKSFVSERKSLVSNKRFIACGAISRAKGFDLLIDSFAEYVKRDNEWVLDIYGKGIEQKSIQRKIDSYGLQERVRLRGVTKQIADEMINSSIFLLSSRWEGMPMVVLEALECGLPVIAYDITAMTPLVDDGVEGRIVQAYDTKAFADAMYDLSKSQELRSEYGKNAAKKALSFDIKTIVDQWEQLF